VLTRYEHGAKRRISHADLTFPVDDSSVSFAITEEARDWHSDAPPSLGGSPVVMQLHVADANQVLSSMRDAGASIVFPIQELLGERMARLVDPFGHIWILRQRVERLTPEEIQARRDELFMRHAASAQARIEEKKRLRDSPAAPQSERERRGQIHLIVGPVGAGKSTYALRLARERRAVHLTLDAWMTELFSPDRPAEGVMEWYAERASRCIEQIWSVATAILAAGTNVILEIGLLRRNEREAFYRKIDQNEFNLSIHVLDASRDVRRERVKQRNQTKGDTFSMVVPLPLFELASDLWEPPEASECEARHVRFLRTD
jgi:predicted kinase/uncharacterized glyoxalase superfamily protein PhnB